MLKDTFVFLTLLIIPFLGAGQLDSLISIQNGSRNIEGSLLLPESESDVPVILIIPGSGATDRDGNNALMTNNSLKMLAFGLYENGIGSLRYDKRGLKGNPMAGETEVDLRFESFVADARNWIVFLNKQEGIGDIHVLGHSQGSLVGILAALETEVVSVISVAGSGQPIDRIIRKQLETQPPVLQEQAAIILDSLGQGFDVTNIHPMLQSLFRPSAQGFIRSWMQYDPGVELAKLNRPVLIVNGTTDIQVGVEQAQHLHTADSNSTLVIIEKMNHVLKKAEADRQQNLSTYFAPDLPLSPELVPAIATFINSE